MTATDTDENWRLLKQFSLPGAQVNTDALLGFEAALMRQDRVLSCPAHIHTDSQRYRAFCDGFYAGRQRLNARLTTISGRTITGDIWMVQRKSHRVSVARLLDQAQRNGVVGDVEFVYADHATGKRKTRTWGL